MLPLNTRNDSTSFRGFTCAFTHAVDLGDGDVEGHEVLDCVAADRSCSTVEAVASIQTHHLLDLLKHQRVGYVEGGWWSLPTRSVGFV